MSGVITVIATANITAWLTPIMMDGSARGSFTLAMVCRKVEPNECAASIDSVDTSRIPRFVRRMSGGTA